MLLKPTAAPSRRGSGSPESLDYRVLIGVDRRRALRRRSRDACRAGSVPKSARVLSRGRAAVVVRAASPTARRGRDRWAKFASDDDRAVVEDDGMVTVRVTARRRSSSGSEPRRTRGASLSRVTTSRFFASRPAPTTSTKCLESWSLGSPRPRPCDDAEFLRRAYLDATARSRRRRRSSGSWRTRPREARERLIDALLGAAGVRRLLGLQVVGPAARLHPRSWRRRRCGRS